MEARARLLTKAVWGLAALVALAGACGDDGSSSGAASTGAGGGGTASTATGTMSGATTTASGAGGAGSMSFFVTSVGNGALGGNFGGLSGADAHCQTLADAVGSGSKTWRAYLSTSAVDARDRIGNGPWYNVNGDLVAADVDTLHGSPPDSALLLDENGAIVPFTSPGQEHDIVTGSTTDGRLFDDGNSCPTCACSDWTSNDPGLYAWVGHTDWSTPENPTDHWSSSHATPCDQAGMTGTGCTSRIYCFATD